MSAETLIADARGYAGNLVSSAAQAMGSAISAVQQVGFLVPNMGSVQLTFPPPAEPLAIIPPLGLPVDLRLPQQPAGILSFQDIPLVAAGTVPALSVAPPTLKLPTEPSQLPGFLEHAPEINTNIAFPNPPTALMAPLFEAPVLPIRAEPEKPQTLLPSFEVHAPTGMPDAPTALADNFDAAYRNAAPSTITMLNGYVDTLMAKYNPRYAEQMDKIENQLSAYLAGGTGLNPAVETAIYERARSKSDAEARRVRDTALKDAVARGFTLPSGALVSALQQARQAASDNNATAAREIVVMQAEMEQKNLQFAVTTSAELRKTVLNAALSYHQNLISINGQALDYAKSILGAIIEVYNTAVKAYGVRLDTYRAEASVHEVRLKAAMAGIELYQAEIQALTALTSVDRAKVDVYRARIEVLTSLSNVYRSQVEAVVGRTNLEKLKLEVFQAKVQTYATQVQGKNAEWQGYTAAIEGQAAVAKIYSVQVEAYGAQINGYKAGIEATSAAVQAAATTNKARADQYAATYQGYTAVVQAEGMVAQTKLENQRQGIIAFQAQSQAAVANAQLKLAYYQASTSVAIKAAEMRMTTQIQEGENRRAYGKSIADLGTANAQIFAGSANAAMSGMNSFAATILTES